jgi:hypothetical protein
MHTGEHGYGKGKVFGQIRKTRHEKGLATGVLQFVFIRVNLWFQRQFSVVSVFSVVNR